MTQEIWGIKDIATYKGVTTAAVSQMMKSPAAPIADFTRPNGNSFWLPENIKQWLENQPETRKGRPKGKYLYGLDTSEGYFALLQSSRETYEVYERTAKDESDYFADQGPLGKRITRFHATTEDEAYEKAVRDIERIVGPQRKLESQAWGKAFEELRKAQAKSSETRAVNFTFQTDIRGLQPTEYRGRIETTPRGNEYRMTYEPVINE